MKREGRCIYWVTRIEPDRETGRWVQYGVLVTGVISVRLRQRQQHWGQANADRTSTAALTAIFTGTLIGPLMSLEKKVVKALEMESVSLCSHSVISTIHAFIYYFFKCVTAFFCQNNNKWIVVMFIWARKCLCSRSNCHLGHLWASACMCSHQGWVKGV